jgi:integrase
LDSKQATKTYEAVADFDPYRATAKVRQGELLGLMWEDLDLKSATLRVRHTLQPPGFPKGAPARLTPPKTRRSLRGMHLPHSAVAAPLRHRELQDADYTNLMPRHFKPLLKKSS